MPFQNLPRFGAPAMQPQQQHPPILMGPPENNPDDIIIEYMKKKFERERGGVPYEQNPPKGFLQRQFERLL